MTDDKLMALLIEQLVVLNENLSRITGVHIDDRDPYDPIKPSRAQSILDQIRSRTTATDTSTSSKLRQMLNNLKGGTHDGK
jgi:hypothetical protein